MAPRTDETDLPDLVLGVVITAMLVMVGVMATVWVYEAVDRRMATSLRVLPDILRWWSSDRSWAWGLPLIVILTPVACIPGAFGIRRWQPVPRLSAGGRFFLVSTMLALIALVMGALYLSAGRDLGIATATHAIWLRDGTPVVQRGWNEAQAVMIGCESRRTRRSQSYDHEITYEVHFADSRTAPLSRGGDRTEVWMTGLEPIDAALRSARVPRVATIDARCLNYYRQSLSKPDQARLQAILGAE